MDRKSSDRKYYEANSDRIRQRARQYYLANRKRILERMRRNKAAKKSAAIPTKPVEERVSFDFV